MKLYAMAALGAWYAAAAGAQTVAFDFDTGTPALARGQSTPFEQTSGGVTARFSSPSGAAFSIQSDASTGWKMPLFSGNYLYDNNLYSNVLEIRFSQPLKAVSMAFATADFQQRETPTTIQLTAYVEGSGTAVGSATAHGTYGNGTMPAGTLSYDAGGKTFNLVQISIPQQPLGASDFFIDNVVAAPAAPGVVASVSAASYAAGAALAPGSIASAFGQNLAAGSEAAALVPLPTTLANTAVKVKDSVGVERQAALFYVGPGQVNYVVPEGMVSGAATVTVVSAGTVTATGSLTIDAVSPGLFTANFDGKGAPAAQVVSVAPDLSRTVQSAAVCGATAGSCVAAPIDLGPSGTQVVLVLYGTGIRGRTSLGGVTAKIGGADAAVQYAGAQGQFTGLDQVNIALPRELAGRGDVDVALTVDGRAANPVRINVR